MEDLLFKQDIEQLLKKREKQAQARQRRSRK